MSKNNEDLLEFLRQQVLWCQQQDEILAEIENKLYQMKELAIYKEPRFNRCPGTGTEQGNGAVGS